MATAKTYALHSDAGELIGLARLGIWGWRFIPPAPGRNPSRKSYPKPEDCLPQWARAYLKTGRWESVTQAKKNPVAAMRRGLGEGQEG